MSVPKFVSPNQEGFRERYRCWDPKDYQNPGENCGSGSEQPGQGALCGRYQSEVCYETERKDCDHSSCDMEIRHAFGRIGANGVLALRSVCRAPGVMARAAAHQSPTTARIALSRSAS